MAVFQICKCSPRVDFKQVKNSTLRYQTPHSSIQSNGQSSIVQQTDAFLKQLLKFHFKTESNNKM